MVTDSHSSTAKAMFDVAHLVPAKAITMGTVYVVLAFSMLPLMAFMYFYLPIVSPKLQNEPHWVLLLVPLFFVYMFSVKAAYWFQTARRLDFFLRAGADGLWVRVPEERDWFLPGYKIVETFIPWKEIRDCFAILHLTCLIPVDSCLVIAKANGEIVSMSTCYFAEGRRQLVKDIMKLWTTNQQGAA